MCGIECLDVATDGRPWQWGVASVLAIALVLPLLPLAVAARAIEHLRGGDADGEHRG